MEKWLLFLATKSSNHCLKMVKTSTQIKQVMFQLMLFCLSNKPSDHPTDPASEVNRPRFVTKMDPVSHSGEATIKTRQS